MSEAEPIIPFGEYKNEVHVRDQCSWLLLIPIFTCYAYCSWPQCCQGWCCAAAEASKIPTAPRDATAPPPFPRCRGARDNCDRPTCDIGRTAPSSPPSPDTAGYPALPQRDATASPSCPRCRGGRDNCAAPHPPRLPPLTPTNDWPFRHVGESRR